MKLWKMMTELNEYVEKLDTEDSKWKLTRLDLAEDIESLRGIYTKVTEFTKLKLLELGRADLSKSNSKLMDLTVDSKKKGAEVPAEKISGPEHLTKDIVENIAQRAWKNFGDQVVNELRQVIISRMLNGNMDSLKAHSNLRSLVGTDPSFASASNLWWKLSFTMLDFLLENDFVTSNTLRNFFLHPSIIERFIKYVEVRMLLDIGESNFLDGSYLITQHWYWPFLHNSFQVIGEKEKDIINTRFLLRLRHHRVLEWIEEIRGRGSKATRFFLQNFDGYRYMELIKLGETAHSISDGSEIRKDVIKIMDLVVMQHFNPTWCERHLYNLLDLITQKVSPGILDEITHDPDLSKERNLILHFETKSSASQLKTKLKYICSQARGYYRFIQKEYPTTWSSNKLYKSKIDTWLLELVQLSRDISDESKKLLRIFGDSDTFQHLNHQLGDIRNKLEEAIHELQDKASTFSQNLI